jgi:sorting nexin-4
VQGLGFLESGITDPLNHFSNTLLEFSALLRHKVCCVDGVQAIR